MKLKYTLFVPMLLLTLTGCPWDKDKKDDTASQNASHDAATDSAPQQSKPYNILDYTKPKP